jgi:hypothetical protein
LASLSISLPPFGLIYSHPYITSLSEYAYILLYSKARIMLDLILLNVATVYFIDVIDKFFLKIERMVLVRNIAIIRVRVDRVVISA